MPSDEVLAALRRALAPRADAFRSAVALTADQVRDALARARDAGGDPAPSLSAELGAFAAGRIDFGRLAAVASPAARAPAADATVLERALDALQRAGSGGDGVVVVDVPAGGSLKDAVATAFAASGRAFGAARIAERARTGRYRAEEHAAWASGLPFASWTRAERRLAPPLLVHVEGADLRAADLAEFLDGAVRIVLAVRGACPPAALARLVTPGLFVLQTDDAWGFERMAAVDGPAVAAVVPSTAACFLHDPARGAHPWERIEERRAAPPEPRGPVGAWSAWQQGEELRHLASLAARPAVAPPAPAPAAAAADARDRLASWLLARAGLADGAR